MHSFLLQTWIGNPDSQYEVAHTAQGLFAPDLTPDAHRSGHGRANGGAFFAYPLDCLPRCERLKKEEILPLGDAECR